MKTKTAKKIILEIYILAFYGTVKNLVVKLYTIKPLN